MACKTKSFDVHKLVISSISQYFREILAKDPSMKRLELPSLSPLGMTPNLCVQVPCVPNHIKLVSEFRSLQKGLFFKIQAAT